MATQKPTSALDGTQQKAMNLMVKQAMGLLLKDDTANMLVQKAKTTDPKTTIVDAITPLLRDIYNMASVAGAKIEHVTVLAAGIQIIAYLAKMFEAADILTEEEIPEFCADVARAAVDRQNAQVWNKVMGNQKPQGGQPPQPGMAGLPPPAPQPQGA